MCTHDSSHAGVVVVVVDVTVAVVVVVVVVVVVAVVVVGPRTKSHSPHNAGHSVETAWAMHQIIKG